MSFQKLGCQVDNVGLMSYAHATMPKQKKQAKLAHKPKKDGRDAEEHAAPKLVMLTGDGHRVSKNITARADCGVPMAGWRYGTFADVKCWDCLTPDERIASPAFEVPPGQFEITDEEVAELPILDPGILDPTQPLLHDAFHAAAARSPEETSG